MAKNLILSPILACLAEIWVQKIFSCILLLIDVRYCRKLSSYSISRKTFNPNSRKWGEASFWAWFRHVGPKFGQPIFFSKIWLCQSLDIMVSYHHVKHPKKLMIQSWKNLLTNGRTDGQRNMISQDAVRLTSSVQQSQNTCCNVTFNVFNNIQVVKLRAHSFFVKY